MKTLLLTMTAIISFSASAGLYLDFNNAMPSNTKDRVKLSKQEFAKVWNSSVITCLKDGSRVIGLNKAFMAAGIKKSKCSPKQATVVKAVTGKDMVVIYAEQIAHTGLLKIK